MNPPHLSTVESVLAICVTIYGALATVLAFGKKTVLKIFDNHLAHFEVNIGQRLSGATNTIVDAIKQEGEQTRQTMRDLAK